MLIGPKGLLRKARSGILGICRDVVVLFKYQSRHQGDGYELKAVPGLKERAECDVALWCVVCLLAGDELLEVLD